MAPNHCHPSASIHLPAFHFIDVFCLIFVVKLKLKTQQADKRPKTQVKSLTEEQLSDLIRVDGNECLIRNFNLLLLHIQYHLGKCVQTFDWYCISLLSFMNLICLCNSTTVQ